MVSGHLVELQLALPDLGFGAADPFGGLPNLLGCLELVPANPEPVDGQVEGLQVQQALIGDGGSGGLVDGGHGHQASHIPPGRPAAAGRHPPFGARVSAFRLKKRFPRADDLQENWRRTALSSELTTHHGRPRLRPDQTRESLRRELEEEVALRQSLLEIGTLLGAATAEATHDIFELLAQRMATVVPIKALTIYVKTADRDELIPVYHSKDLPQDEQAITGFHIPFGLGATGWAAESRRSVISNLGDPAGKSVDIPGSSPVDDHLLAVPVLVEERVKAVLTLRRLEDQPPFTMTDAHRAELFAQHVATVFLLAELAESRRLLSEQVEKLKDLNRLKDEFVANVSHELRTPLTAILGNVMTVAGLGDMLGAAERRELLRAAERQGKRLGELLENLLAESRLTGSDPGLTLSRVDLAQFLDEVADTLRFRGPARAIETHTVGRVELVTDRTLLYRVLFNLGDNALKYSDGPVSLTARRSDGGVQIDVRDAGIGIAPEDVARIFGQFEQLDGSTSRRVGGVGLGLHLCASAVAALGGRVWVDSSPGRGSTFYVWLPSSVPLAD
ncbi:MAG TPA: GAF domain-containing sensor histidine kinase [Actinomycetota bacterium]|nr:GAF domain-containing sensor histidine kinase [Actinomycetota bacterium]